MEGRYGNVYMRRAYNEAKQDSPALPLDGFGYPPLNQRRGKEYKAGAGWEEKGRQEELT